MRILITGGCGFIGSATIRHIVRHSAHEIVNVDLLTYAASIDALEEAHGHPRHRLVQADIADAEAMRRVFIETRPDAVMHLAAESHVDRSIDGPADFIRTNIVGTFTLLEAARAYFANLDADAKAPLPLPPRLHGRGVRRAGGWRPAIHRNHAVRSPQPLLGQQGRLGPSGARLAAHVRATDPGQQHGQ